MGKATELNESTFDSMVLKADKPALVDFWAAWCGPCRMVGPVVEAVAEKFEGRALVGKVNVDEVPALANKYGVRSIPTLILFKAGEPAERLVGVQTEDALSSLLEKAIGG
jgi:thioredoxin 1